MTNKAKEYLASAIKNQESGDYKKAVILAEKSLEIKDDPLAKNILATCYQQLGDYTKAEKIFVKAITDNHHFLETYLNLALIHFSYNQPDKAFEYLMQPFIKDKKITFNKNTNIWVKSLPYINISLNLIATKFKTLNKIHLDVLKFSLSDPDVRTKDLRPALSFYSDAILNDINNNISLTKDEKLKSVSENSLISSYLINEVNTGMITENFLLARRTLISGYIANNKINEKYKIYIQKILKIIVMQCLNNQYIWVIPKRDQKNIKIIEERVLKNIVQEKKFDVLDLLILISYEEISSYKRIYEFLKIQPKTRYPELKDIIKREILDREEEKSISNDIKSLSSIKDNISKKVKNQYEENPYPRWIGLTNIQSNKDLRTGESYNNYLKVITNNLPVKGKELKVKRPKILIAGCGTGRQPISIAVADKNVIIDAFDISLASLSYGVRMAKKLGINNINWFQADILDLKKLDKKYDMIECVGVLHHMEDPKKGFSELKKKLKPFGLMKLGLYAKHFRDGRFKDFRNIAKKENYGTDLNSIRRFRDHIKNSNNELSNIIKGIYDFNSSSNFRDLLMHAHESSYTIPKLIKTFEIGKNFNFLGFEFPREHYNRIINEYSKAYPKDTLRNNLENWDKFEEKNPDLFAMMYQFYLQKKQ